MPDYLPSPAYRDTGPYRTGVLLVNSGTPDALTTGGVRDFLRRLLSDRRTIETPRAIWNLILYGIIGFAVMVSVWGLVNILLGTFNLNSNIPRIPPTPGTR